MKRLENWRDRLRAYVRATARMPFEFGTNDCALFAAGAIREMTGVDLAAEFRGQYSDEATGRVLLAKSGFNSPIDMLAAHFPEAERARAGDICVVYGDVTGVSQGRAVYVLTADGIATVPATAIERVFRV